MLPPSAHHIVHFVSFRFLARPSSASHRAGGPGLHPKARPAGATWRRRLVACLLAFWLPTAFAAGPAPAFTDEERDWIRAHPVVRVASEPSWRPFEYVDRGRRVGIIPSYLDAISLISGLHFEPVQQAQWGHSLRMLQEGQLDLLPDIWNESIHARFGDNAVSTTPYLVCRIAIVTANDHTMVFDLGKLTGKRVAIKRDGGIEYFLRSKYPGIEILRFKDEEQALEAVRDGLADAAIGVDASMLPTVRRRFTNRLFVSGMAASHPVSVSMVTRKDMPILASIIDKSLAAMSSRQTEAILDQWLGQANYGQPTFESILRYRWKQLLAVAVAMLGFAILALISMKARARAVRSERDKSAFLAFMSHEVRTPMHTVLSSLELLQGSRLDPALAERTSAAIVASETLLALLDEVLEYSRVGSRGARLERIATPIGAWADDTLDMVRCRAEKKGLSLSLEIECNPQLTLLIDPMRLRQIVSNLLINAIKFTDQGWVGLRIGYAQTTRSDWTGTLTLEVFDTGIGILPEQLPHLFDAYWQAEQSSRRSNSGAGLGLAICKELCVLMGGSIDVQSTLGGNTSFTVRIPALIEEPGHAPPTARRAPPPLLAGPPRPSGDASTPESSASPAPLPLSPSAETPDARRKPQLLVVDDHEAVQLALRSQLDALGCASFIAGTGSAALAAFEHGAYDMVLLDCNLPDISGYTVAERMREWEAATGRHTPLIAISAATDDEHRMRCVTSGMDGILAKPLRLGALRELIAMWCPDAAIGAPVESPAAPAPSVDAPGQFNIRALEGDIALLKHALDDNDPEGARYAIHRIRGAAHIAGWEHIAEIAGLWETHLLEHGRPTALDA
ncbi:ATP-binding protein [Burkholderia sp. FERM BP-3421]|uniref:ATP-binding protein n=1 Tax=Burkholderia sp. FERM BP-3421 TaxID=1494466 RepID=UPI00235E1293|nr:ATP-binding protein [Burkholderia sp. FERM BP-3421]WDD93153.1 ATP-binding protein [Burkholderia sp. FERM BP-3421]